MRFIFLLLFALSTVVAHATCDIDLNGLTFDKIEAMRNRTGVKEKGPTEAEIRLFFKSAYPYLATLASENDVQLPDMMEEYFALSELAMGSLNLMGNFNRATLVVMATFRNSFVDLDRVAARTKFKANHWLKAKMAYLAIQMFAHFAIDFERVSGGKPSFNPFDPVDETYIRHVISSLDDSAFERMAKWSEFVLARQLPTRYDRLRRKPVVEQAPVSEVEVPEPMPLRPEPVAEVEEVERGPTDLVSLIQNDEDIVPGHSYFVKTIYGKDLSVIFSPTIAKEFINGTREPMRRLLRGIVTGRGDKAGIKKLYDLGPKIIELKAIMNGHKRIFGCLDGATLTLKKFMDIKESRSAYFKIIPHTFCD